jgi:hypothetical protein
MPLTKEDIKKYGTEEEKNFLLETVIDEEIVDSWSNGEITIKLVKKTYDGYKFNVDYDLYINGVYDCYNKEVGIELFSKLKELLK